MSRFSPLVVVSCAALLVAAAPVETSADPIQITDGRLEIAGLGGTLFLAAEPGFTFLGGLTVVGGFFGPSVSCLPCAPGASVNLNALWGGNDLHGTATFGGITYEGLGSLAPGSSFGTVEFTSAASLTAPLDGVVATLVGPFGFQGHFFFPGADPESPSFTGAGTATVTLFRPSNDIPWSFQSAVYEFGDASAPVPEPGTLLLVGTVLAGLGASASRQRGCFGISTQNQPRISPSAKPTALSAG
jgi:hypothetical protein